MESPGSAPPGNGTPRIFRWSYGLIAWLSTLGFVGLTIWLLWTLFVHTASGTAHGLSVEISKATQTAVYQAMPTPTAGSGAVELPQACKSCHTIAGASASGIVCPELTHIATLAAGIIASPDYTGKAKTAEDYIRESILDPNAYVVPNEPGKGPYSTVNPTTGQHTSVMPASIGQTLSPGDLDAIVKYLASLK